LFESSTLAAIVASNRLRFEYIEQLSQFVWLAKPDRDVKRIRQWFYTFAFGESETAKVEQKPVDLIAARADSSRDEARRM